MKKYIHIMQGMKIGEFSSKLKALKEAKKANDRWLEYKQYCLDNDEVYADTSIEVYEEEKVGRKTISRLIWDAYGKVESNN